MDVTDLTFSDDEGLVVALAVATLASRLTDAESTPKRKERKARIVVLKLEMLETTGLHLTSRDTQSLALELARRVQGWQEPKRNALLIDVAFAEPFAPYEVEMRQRDRGEQLANLCADIGLPIARAEQILETIAAARRAHRRIEWGRIAATAAVGAIVVAVGGYAAAPLIAAKLGAAAGLSGAAAVSHGLALLGGGSLAVGGGGVAGGMTLVAGFGGAMGGLGAGGATALWNAGYAAALAEIVKLQVTFKEVLLRTQLRAMQAAEVIETLVRQRDELEQRLTAEKALNDEKASRIKNLERILQGYDDAINWMRAQPPGAL